MLLRAWQISGCDLIIEAVFENQELKAKVTQEAEQYLSANGVMASNTSTLPISDLAQASQNQANFIGLHFFSPVDKMQLVEIIKGKILQQKHWPRHLTMCSKLASYRL